MVAGLVVILVVQAEQNTLRVSSLLHPNYQLTGERGAALI